jgi:hypothetical protein
MSAHPFFTPPTSTMEARGHQWERQMEKDPMSNKQLSKSIKKLLNRHEFRKRTADKISQEVEEMAAHCDELSRQLMPFDTIAQLERCNDVDPDAYALETDSNVLSSNTLREINHEYFFNLSQLDEKSLQMLKSEHHDTILGIRSFWRSQISKLNDFSLEIPIDMPELPVLSS